MKNKSKPFHPQLYEYLKKYQNDPTSRVFAPLAESYRKAGFVEEAIEIAREGLIHHPKFMGGKVALGRALFDKKMYLEVIEELSEVVKDAPDNIVGQKLLAESHLILGNLTEALDSYKMLLFFTPQDPEVIELVKELEIQAYEKGTLVLRSDHDLDFDVRPLNEAVEGDPIRQKSRKITSIKRLQALLQRVERYKVQNEISNQN